MRRVPDLTLIERDVVTFRGDKHHEADRIAWVDLLRDVPPLDVWLCAEMDMDRIAVRAATPARCAQPERGVGGDGRRRDGRAVASQRVRAVPRLALVPRSHHARAADSGRERGLA